MHTHVFYRRPAAAAATPAPPQFVRVPASLSLRAGDAARFDCMVSARPRADVHWLRSDNSELHIDGHKYRTMLDVTQGVYTLFINDVQVG